MTATATKPSNTSPPPTNKDFLGSVKSKGSGLPNIVVLHGTEGIGKSSIFSYAKDPIFIMSRGETGLETLIDAGRVSDTPHFPECQNWPDLLGMIDSLIMGEHNHKSLVLDTLNGFERLCHEAVCQREYKGNWGDTGFMSFQKGFDVSLADWQELLFKLQTLRNERKMAIFCIAHTKVENFKNPEGPDYDRYVPDMHKKTWGITHKWADMVLFYNFHTIVEKVDPKGKKGKGVGGTSRFLYTVKTAAYDAKNRHGLDEEIDMGDSGEEAWTNLKNAVIAAKKASSEA